MKRYNTIITLILFFLPLLISCGGRNSSILSPQTIQTTVNLKVKVVNSINNQPVIGAQVTIKLDNKSICPDKRTDSNGETTFQGLTPMDGYKVFINNAIGYNAGTSETIKLITDQEVIIPLKPQNGEGLGLIAGSVKDFYSHQPIQGVTVTILPQGNSSMSSYRNSYYNTNQYRVFNNRLITTDNLGQFTFDSIPAGTYSITFNKPGYIPFTKDGVKVNNGNSSTVETIFLKSSYGTGNRILVTLNDRVVEIDRSSGNIVWTYKSIGSLTSASRLPDGDTLITNIESGIKRITKDGKTKWTWGSFLGIGKLKTPTFISSARDGITSIVADTEGNKILEISDNKVVWSYSVNINRPRSATYTPNGNILIADTGNKRVIEVNRTGQIVWGFTKDMDKPTHAIRLDNGNTLITDSGYSRVLEVSPRGIIVWHYVGVNPKNNVNPDENIEENYLLNSNTNTPQTKENLLYPKCAIRLLNGNTLIADTGNNRIIQVNSQKQIVWEMPLNQPISLESL